MSEDQAIDAELLRRLYTVPPAEFVATRKVLVAERRQANDRAGATAIAGLRKPSGVDVALNLVSAQEPDVVEAFLTAAAAVREAQTAAAEGRSGASARDALRELRAQTATLVATAGRTAKTAGGHRGDDGGRHRPPGRAGGQRGGGRAVAGRPPRLRRGRGGRPLRRRGRRLRPGAGPCAAGDEDGVAPRRCRPAPDPPRQDPKAVARRERREAALARAVDRPRPGRRPSSTTPTSRWRRPRPRWPSSRPS